MPNLLGCYWSPGHSRPTDLQYMQQLNAPAIRILDPDPQQIAGAHSTVPGALILPRDWALSEQHDDMMSDPVQTGTRHAQEWRDKIDKWRGMVANFPPDQQIVVAGINEPHVWEQIPPVVDYTVAFLDACAERGLRACALNLPVGWPYAPPDGSPPQWEPYAPVEAAILRYGHFLTLHEYWYFSGPQDEWLWKPGRVLQCPWDVPVIIGECGIDCYCNNDQWLIDGGNRGWKGHVSGSDYAAQISEYISGLDDRIFAILPFTTDFRSPDWSTFDTADAHSEIVKHNWNLSLPEFAPDPMPPEPEPPPTWTPFCHPAPGAVITQHFYEPPPQYGLPGHDGTDLALAEGESILAITQGTIAYTGWDDGYGNYIRIHHPQHNAYSFYAHLSEYFVTVGQPVAVAQPIAHCGSTGNSTGPHLHLEIRLAHADGSYSELAPMAKGRCDPETWLAERGVKL